MLKLHSKSDASQTGINLKNQITVIPKSEFRYLVRLGCEGEFKDNIRHFFEEQSFPKDHPIFEQKPNCPVPKLCGVPLIVTKLDLHCFEKHHDRKYCENVRCTRLKIDVESGLAVNHWADGSVDVSDQDYNGPVYVCRQDGNWRAQEALHMDDYLSSLDDYYSDGKPTGCGPSKENLRRFQGGNMWEKI